MRKAPGAVTSDSIIALSSRAGTFDLASKKPDLTVEQRHRVLYIHPPEQGVESLVSHMVTLAGRYGTSQVYSSFAKR